MQFQFQVPLDELGQAGKLLLTFQCQNDPGMCDEWDPASGGNAALVTKAEDGRVTESPGLTAEQLREFKEDRTVIAPAIKLELALSGKNEVGAVGGAPEWIQADETPVCKCGERMRLAVQLDENAHEQLNFGGGGRAYAFICEACMAAKFLWQQ